MNSIKYIITLLIISPIWSKSQVYPAGTILPYYFDINPDTVLNIIGNNSPTEYYNLDVNNDLINDFKFQSVGAGGLGGGTHYINITPLNTNSFIRFGRKDSTWHAFYSYWMYTPLAKPLQVGDSVNSMVSVWKNTMLYLTDNTGSAGSYTQPQDWINPNDLYLGLKYQNATDTIYGWVRVNCPSMWQCTINDFSFSKCINACVGIKEHERAKTLKIIPNPSNSKIRLVFDTEIKKAEIKVINELGQIVYMDDIDGKLECVLDLENYVNGLYLLEVKGENKACRGKFVKE